MVYARDGGTATVEMVETTGKEREALVLSDNEVLQLAKWGRPDRTALRSPYGYGVGQGRQHRGTVHRFRPDPRAVQSQRTAGTLKTYKLKAHPHPETILTGLSIGDAIAAGKVCRVLTPKRH